MGRTHSSPRLDRLKRRVAYESRALYRRLAGRPSARKRAFASFAELTQLALPIAGAMAGEVVLGLVDTKLVSGLGAAALGGVGLGMTVMYLWYSIVFGILRGVKVRAAYAVGEGRPADATRYAHAGVLIGLALGAVLFVIGRDASFVFRALGADAAIQGPAVEFFRAITWGAPATCALNALIQHRQAIGDARTPMYAGLAGNAFNAILGYALIYGKLGMPALGVAGSGYATAITENLELVWLGLLFVRDARKGAAPAIGLEQAAREVASLGVPTGLHFGAELLAFTAFTAILGSLGSHEIAAHQIALATIRASFLPGLAVGEAASVLVGRALGRRAIEEADRVTYAALALAMSFMATCGIAFGLGGEFIGRLFTSDASVANIVRKLLLVAAAFQLLDAANIVLRGALRGAKDVRFIAIVGVSVVWVFVPGSALLFGKALGMGALGGWLGFLAETTIASAVLFVRYRRGRWRAEYESRRDSVEMAAVQAA
jgi:multidrug resistance protein, MATE family